MKTALYLCSLSLVLSACGQDPTPELADARVRRAESTLLPGSCADSCGGASHNGECWCDSLCVVFNDCCADKAELCDAYEPCDGKACGDACTLCAPWDTSCFETEVVKSCNQEGVCQVGPAECGCPPVECELLCAAGFATDDNGCEICECVECPSTDEICAAICAGEPEPDTPAGCPIPGCQCDTMCGGIAGLPCPEGHRCVDDPNDGCELGVGADCAGICEACPDPDDPTVHYVANSNEDPSICAVILFHCEGGQEPFTNECGCGCIDVDPTLPVVCNTLTDANDCDERPDCMWRRDCNDVDSACFPNLDCGAGDPCPEGTTCEDFVYWPCPEGQACGVACFPIQVCAPEPPPMLTCDDIECLPGTHCETIEAVCPGGSGWCPMPVCEDDPTCNTVDCPPGQHCELLEVQCFTTPCFPLPTCIDDVPSNTCQEHCGGASEDGTCYCDFVCSWYGDCCTDYTDICL